MLSVLLAAVGGYCIGYVGYDLYGTVGFILALPLAFLLGANLR